MVSANPKRTFCEDVSAADMLWPDTLWAVNHFVWQVYRWRNDRPWRKIPKCSLGIPGKATMEQRRQQKTTTSANESPIFFNSELLYFLNMLHRRLQSEEYAPEPQRPPLLDPAISSSKDLHKCPNKLGLVTNWVTASSRIPPNNRRSLFQNHKVRYPSKFAPMMTEPNLGSMLEGQEDQERVNLNWKHLSAMRVNPVRAWKRKS